MIRHRTQGAFTLIELLVVVSIVALLIALLLPSLAQARETAKGMLCMSHQRQIYLGFAAYVEDNKEVVPPAYDGLIGDMTWARFLAVGQYLEGIGADEQVGKFFASGPASEIRTLLHCPSEATHGGGFTTRAGYNHFIYGQIREDYAINIERSGRWGYPGSYLGGFLWSGYKGGKTGFYSLTVKSGLGLEQNYIGSPTDTFLLADGNYMDHEPTHNLPTSTSREFGIIYRHLAESTTMVFFDGHAQQNHYPGWDGMNGYPNGRWNDMPEEPPW